MGYTGGVMGFPGNVFGQLDARLRKAAGIYRYNAAKTTREFFRVAAHDIIEHTPVDTGESRSNWILGRSNAPHHPRAPYVAYSPMTLVERQSGEPKIRFAETANADAAKLQIDAVLAELTPKEVTGGVELTLSGTDISEALDSGDIYSRQQPRGFVDRALQKAKVWLIQQKNWSGFKDF